MNNWVEITQEDVDDTDGNPKLIERTVCALGVDGEHLVLRDGNTDRAEIYDHEGKTYLRVERQGGRRPLRIRTRKAAPVVAKMIEHGITVVSLYGLELSINMSMENK